MPKDGNKGKEMLKQEIAQFKEYRKLSKQLEELDLRNICAFGEFSRASGKISKLKTKWMPNVKPRPEFWGLADYPCIINHQGDNISQLLGLLTGESDMITFYCPKYSSDTPCTNETCMHWANNQHYFYAKKAWLECSEKYEAVKKEYDTVREQLFGKRKAR